MAIKTLIFDFDGTIADSLEATVKIANRLAPEYQYKPVVREDWDTLRASSYRHIATHIGIAWHRIPQVAVRIRRELAAQVPNQPLVEGLGPVLRELHKRCRLGILTSNSRANVEAFLAAHALAEVFDFIETASNVWGKGRRLRSLLRARGLDPAEVAYVGDEVRDVEATRSQSIRMVAVSWGYSARTLLAAEQPEHLIDAPSQLLDVLTEVGGV